MKRDSANGCFGKVDQTGGTLYPAPSPDWDLEISLDLDMVTGPAPQRGLAAARPVRADARPGTAQG